MNDIFTNLQQQLDSLTVYKDPCTIALEADAELMKIHEPYKIIHGRVYDTKEEYEQALHDFLNENWCP